MKEKDTKTQNKPKTKGLKVFGSVINTIINIMIVLVLIISVLIAVMAVSSKANGGISNVFGYTIQPILSDSMKGGSPDGYPSGDFENGDLMIAKATNFDINQEYDLGDIVTFRTKDKATDEMILIAHRVVDAVDSNGLMTYQTQGDNHDTSPVPDQLDTKDYLRPTDIGSVYYTNGYEGKILKGWGKILSFLQSQQGFFFVILLPMIIFFIYELIRVVLNFTDYKKAVAMEEKEEAVKAAVADALSNRETDSTEQAFEKMSDDEKEQFKQFLAMQKAQQEAEQAPPEDTEA